MRDEDISQLMAQILISGLKTLNYFFRLGEL